jgi:hypothetical protein
VAYEMRGQFLEACDCSVPCPCWFVEDPDEGECTGIIAWHIEQGEIDGVEVTGLTAVSVSQHSGARGAPGEHANMRIALIVDERASEEQEQAVARAFTGKLGGPLAELAEMTHDTPEVTHAPIEFRSDGASTRLSVGELVRTEMTPVVGATGRITTIADSVMAEMLGLGEVGKASTLRFNLSTQGIDLSLENRSATRGRFRYAVR